MGVVDLEKSGDASSLRKIQRQARYDTTAIEWNPHIGMDHQLISTVRPSRNNCIAWAWSNVVSWL